MKNLMGLESTHQTGDVTLSIVQSIFLFSSAVIFIGYLLNRKLSSSAIQKTVLQTGILAILIFIAVTVTGQGNAISQCISSHFLVPQYDPSQPATELHTSFDSESTLLEILPADPEIFAEHRTPLAVRDLNGDESKLPPDETVKDENPQLPDHIISIPPEEETVDSVGDLLVELHEEESIQDEKAVQDEKAAAVLHQSQSEQNHWLKKASFAFIAIWGIGTIIFLARLLVGRLLLVFYCRRLNPSNDPAVESSVSHISRLLGHRRSIRILESKNSATPVALGMFRPTLILPTRMIVELDRRQRDVMLAHEIAHLSSGDPAWTFAMDVLHSVLWWHPAVWYLKKQLNHVNEHYADEASLVVEGGPTSLAECLVDLGARLIQEKKVEWVSLEGIPMSGRNSGSRNFRSSLGQRVARLLSLNDNNRQQFARPKSNSLKMCGSLLIVASVLIGQTWANPRSFYKGESTVSVFKNHWKKSLAGVAILSFLGSPSSYADDVKKDDGKEKKVVLELKEAKPAKNQKHVVKDVIKVIELDGKQVHESHEIHKAHNDGVVIELHGDGKHEVIELAGKKVYEVHKIQKSHVVLELHGDDKHEVIELSGSPAEMKKKLAIYIKKATARIVKIAKSGDKKQAAAAKKKLIALKKAFSVIQFDGGKGKARIQFRIGDNKKSQSIRQRIVIGKDGNFSGKLPAGVRIIQSDNLDKKKFKLLLQKSGNIQNVEGLKKLIELKSFDGKLKGQLPQRVRVIRADKLNRKELKILIEKATKSGNRVELKKLFKLAETTQDSAQSRARRSGSKSRSEFSKLFSRVGRPQASRKIEGELTKIHEKISHLKKAAESLKAAGLAKQAKELLVTAEKLSVAANKQAAQHQKAQAEKQFAAAMASRRQVEVRNRQRQVEARRRTERRLVETVEKAVSRSRTNRTTATNNRRSRNADVNAELLQVIRQLSKEMKELRKDVNNLKKKIDN